MELNRLKSNGGKSFESGNSELVQCQNEKVVRTWLL
jgi:hypothetical protein